MADGHLAEDVGRGLVVYHPSLKPINWMGVDSLPSTPEEDPNPASTEVTTAPVYGKELRKVINIFS